MLKIFSGIWKVSSGIGISRIFGYIRDMLVANVFGATMFADSFYAAFRIPNLFRRLLGEGALSASFVPVLNNYLENETNKETQKFINVTFSALFLVTTGIVILGIIFAKPITSILAFGFTAYPQKYLLTVKLTKLLFPFLALVCISAFIASTLISLKRFFLPSISPVFISISEILFILLIVSLFVSPIGKIKGLAISVVIGGLIQLFLQLFALIKRGYRISFKLNFYHPGLRKSFFLFLPVMLSFSIEQVNAFVDTICASFLQEGSMTALYYSNRLVQLPLALFGISTAIVGLSTMSTHIARGEIEKMKEVLSSSLRMVIFIVLPASFGLLCLGLPIIKVLFERGEFTPLASNLTYLALLFYSFGLIAFCGIKVLASSFYSLQLPSFPMRVAISCMFLNAILNVILMRPLGVGGLAFASAISAWLNVSLLFFLICKRLGDLQQSKITDILLKSLAVSALMGLLGIILFEKLPSPPLISLTITILVCVWFYFSVSKFLKIEEANLILKYFAKNIKL